MMNHSRKSKRTHRPGRVVALWVAIGVLIAAGGAFAASGYRIGRSVIGGGGQEASGGGFVLHGTLGEPVASSLQVGPAHGLSSGFWQPRPTVEVYLPVVQREAGP